MQPSVILVPVYRYMLVFSYFVVSSNFKSRDQHHMYMELDIWVF